MGHNFNKPLSLKGFWALIIIRHHYLLKTLFFIMGYVVILLDLH